MGKYRVTFADGEAVVIYADNGTQAKADARRERGLKKSECKITNVEAAPEQPAYDRHDESDRLS